MYYFHCINKLKIYNTPLLRSKKDPISVPNIYKWRRFLHVFSGIIIITAQYYPITFRLNYTYTIFKFIAIEILMFGKKNVVYIFYVVSICKKCCFILTNQNNLITVTFSCRESLLKIKVFYKVIKYRVVHLKYPSKSYERRDELHKTDYYEILLVLIWQFRNLEWRIRIKVVIWKYPVEPSITEIISRLFH